jgi:hypothetical protein
LNEIQVERKIHHKGVICYYFPLRGDGKYDDMGDKQEMLVAQGLKNYMSLSLSLCDKCKWHLNGKQRKGLFYFNLIELVLSIQILCVG